MMIKKNWVYKKIDEKVVEKIKNFFNLKYPIVDFIIKRVGTAEKDIEDYLEPTLKKLPEPALMTDLEKGVKRIIDAIAKKEKVVIYGDYDADGVTATGLLLLFFKDLEYPVDFYIPERIKEGYGLNITAIDELRNKGTKLIITVDCGISDYEIVDYGKNYGIDFVITDHHIPQTRLPEAVAVINPKRKDCKFPFKDLAGVGVAFYLLIELRKQLRLSGYFEKVKEPNLKQYLDLVAIGTIADMVPLLGPNRIFVKHGLEEINKTRKKGLEILREELLIETMDVRSVSFRIAPRINASGRVSSPKEALKLLLTSDEIKARQIVKQLHKNNTQRQKLEELALNDALQKIENLGERLTYCLYSPNWHQGVLGIVAGKLVDRLKRPCFVFTNDEDGILKGSGRSIEGFPLDEVLFLLKDYLIDYGGHKLACGLAMEKKFFEIFSQKIEDLAKKILKGKDFCEMFYIDGILEISEIDDEFFKQLDMLEPFGYGNSEPVFLLQGVEVINFRYVGSKENHLKMVLKKDGSILNAIGFSLANNGIQEKSKIDIIGLPKRTEFNGLKRWDFYIKDFDIVGY